MLYAAPNAISCADFKGHVPVAQARCDVTKLCLSRQLLLQLLDALGHDADELIDLLRGDGERRRQA